MKVEFLAKSTDPKLLQKALEALGCTVNQYLTELRFSHPSGRGIGTYNATTGQLTVPDSWDITAEEMKPAYGKQAVIATAKRGGWEVEWKRDADGNEVAEVERRTY